MTRQEILALAKLELGEYLNTPGADNSFSWDLKINSVTDDIARLTDAYYVEYSADLVSGQQAYCQPEIYKVKAVNILSPDGKLCLLSTGTPQMLDSIYGSRWRNDPVEGTPRIYLTRGNRNALLYATPNYTTTGDTGLIIEGFACPWTGWAQKTDECPLPQRAHAAVVAGAAYQRAGQIDQVSDRKMGYLRGRWLTLLGELEGEAYTLTEATKAGRVNRTRYSNYIW